MNSFASPAFQAAPSVWNSLPRDITNKAPSQSGTVYRVTSLKGALSMMVKWLACQFLDL